MGARRSQVRRLAQDGHGLAVRLLPIIDDPRRLDTYIATCQIGITLSSLLLGAYGQVALGPGWTKFFASYVGDDKALAVSLATGSILVALTGLQIVFGELFPKTLALQFPVRMALATYFPVAFSERVMAPFISFLNGSGNLVLKIMKVPPSVHRHIHSLEEIDMLLTESRKGGVLKPEEEDRLHRALHLSSQMARQIMTPSRQIFAVNQKANLNDCFELMSEGSFTRAIAHGDGGMDDIIGLVNIKKVVSAMIAEPRPDTIEQLVEPVPVVPPTLTVDRLIRLMRERNSQMAVVKDEHGATLGIVSVQDILSELMGTALAGESRTSAAERVGPASIRLPGAFKLSRAREYLGELPEHDSDTLSGLIVEELERIPKKGDVVKLRDVNLIVEKVARNVVVSVIVRRLSEKE